MTAKLTSVPGYTADNIAVPQGYSDSELTKAGYTSTATGPDGEVYDTMAKALAANPIFDARIMDQRKIQKPRTLR